MKKGKRFFALGISALAIGFAPGCYTGLAGFGGGGNGSADGGEDAGDDGDGDGDGGDDGLGPEAEMPVPTTRFFRLTHDQWENTVQDLLGLDMPTGLSSEFRADPAEGGFIFGNNALTLEVDEALWSGYQRAAVDVAEMAATDQTILDRIAPDPGDEATRAADFIRNFGLQVYRRPLTDDEIAEYQMLFDRGPELYEDTTGFAAGVRLVLEGMFQSPHFLYRVESSTDIIDDVIPLGSYEIASRMSYFLWDTMPDAELLDVASADSLSDPEMVAEQARRMLESPRARGVVQRFHHHLLEAEKFAQVTPSATVFPDAPEDLGALAQVEHDMFLDHVVFDSDGTWRDLLTSNETFVNNDLAAIYGVEGSFDDNFQRVELDPAQRSGVFTQVGWLAANSTSVHPDPILRGAFLAQRIACHTIAAPPDNLPPLPEPDANATNRETVTAHTEAEGSTCSGCHTPLINPFGFPFEHYDATGAYRETDNGSQVDATATVLLQSGAVDVDNALDLASALAEDDAVHRCYMRHWMEFAMGRPADDLDDPLVDRLSTESLDDMAVKDLLVGLATSRPFLTRAAEEME